MEIVASARKHGISDDDIRHAFTNAVAAITAPDQPDFAMLIGADLAAIVAAFDDTPDDKYSVTDTATLAELRAAAAARREAEGRIEAAALAAHRAGLSWGVIGAQLGMTRQGARQRFERLVDR